MDNDRDNGDEYLHMEGEPPEWFTAVMSTALDVTDVAIAYREYELFALDGDGVSDAGKHVEIAMVLATDNPDDEHEMLLAGFTLDPTMAAVLASSLLSRLPAVLTVMAVIDQVTDNITRGGPTAPAHPPESQPTSPSCESQPTSPSCESQPTSPSRESQLTEYEVALLQRENHPSMRKYDHDSPLPFSDEVRDFIDQQRREEKNNMPRVSKIKLDAPAAHSEVPVDAPDDDHLALQQGDDRPSRYVEVSDSGEETVVYRASSLGGCLRAYVAMARGRVPEPNPEWIQEVFNEGHEAEPLIRAAFMDAYDCEVVADQEVVTLELGTINGRRVIVRGHHDGKVLTRSDSGSEIVTLFEAKKFRESTWEKFQRDGIECNVNYPWQVSVYMHAIDADECFFTGGRVSFDNWDNLVLEEIEVKFLSNPPFSLAAIRKRVKAIEEVINAGFDVAEVECNNSQYPCPYWKLHDVVDSDTYALPDDERTRTILARIASNSKQRKQLEADAKRVKAEENRAVDDLRELIAGLGPEALAAKKLTSGLFTVNHVRGHFPERVAKAYDTDYFTIVPNKGNGASDSGDV